MATKGLTVQDFQTQEEAFKAADDLIKLFQEMYPDLKEKHPDQLFPDMPQLDSFWFAEFKGMQGHIGTRQVEETN